MPDGTRNVTWLNLDQAQKDEVGTIMNQLAALVKNDTRGIPKVTLSQDYEFIVTEPANNTGLPVATGTQRNAVHFHVYWVEEV